MITAAVVALSVITAALAFAVAADVAVVAFIS